MNENDRRYNRQGLYYVIGEMFDQVMLAPRKHGWTKLTEGGYWKYIAYGKDFVCAKCSGPWSVVMANLRTKEDPLWIEISSSQICRCGGCYTPKGLELHRADLVGPALEKSDG